MNYTDTAGNPATGVVWSPGPLPGTVWVLPYSGASASEARVVHVRRKVQIRDVPRAMHRHVLDTFKDAQGFSVPGFRAPLFSDGIPANAYPVDIAAHRQAFNDGRGLPAKDWHAALGYDPRDVVRGAAAGSAPPAEGLMLDLAVA